MKTFEFILIGIFSIYCCCFIILSIFGKTSIHNDEVALAKEKFLNDIGYTIIQMYDKSIPIYQKPSIRKKKPPTHPTISTSNEDFHFFNISHALQ